MTKKYAINCQGQNGKESKAIVFYDENDTDAANVAKAALNQDKASKYVQNELHKNVQLTITEQDSNYDISDETIRHTIHTKLTKDMPLDDGHEKGALYISQNTPNDVFTAEDVEGYIHYTGVADHAYVTTSYAIIDIA